METAKSPNGINGTPSSEQLNRALMNFHDLMTRTFVRPLVLGETAKSLKYGEVTGDKIEAGIRAQDLKVEYVLTTLTEWINREDNPVITDEMMSYTVDGVPVEIKIIKKNWAFLKQPDIMVYRSDEYFRPNPFDKYYTARHLL